jgi:fumarylpyruvate hydrolase
MTSPAPAYAVPQPEVIALPVTGSASLFPVRRIYCVGRNYVEHIREMKEGDERDPPFFFQKPRDAIVMSGATIPYPVGTADFQHEIELVIAIGKGGRAIRGAHALDHVYGYAIGIDLTRRDRQVDMRKRMLPWEAGKAFDRSAPCGPVHLASLVGHRLDGAITLSVNGRERQRGDLSQMIWNVPEIVAKLSEDYTIEAGDIIMTGTPAGVGPVVPGDEMTGAIDGLGKISIVIGKGEA